MRKLTISAALLLIPFVSHATYLGTKTEWDEMNALTQAAYISGYLDGFLTPIVGDDDSNKYRADVGQCLFDLQLSSSALVEAVEKSYEEIEQWSKAPYEVLLSSVHRICVAKINEYRTERGEEALEASDMD
jgi:hypothetical protein